MARLMDISDHLFKRAGEMYEKELLCDVTILIEHCNGSDQRKQALRQERTSNSIECHSLILGAFSEVMLHSLLKQSKAYKVLSVSGYSVELMSSAIGYMYTGMCELSDSRAIELVHLSHRWKIKCLQDHVIHYMENNANMDNCVIYYESAVTLDISSLKQKTEKMVKLNFSKVFHGCCRWHFKSMDALFGSRFTVETEDLKMMCISKWAQEHSDEREHIEILVRYINVSDLSERMTKTCLEDRLISVAFRRVKAMQLNRVPALNGHTASENGVHSDDNRGEHDRRNTYRDISSDGIDGTQAEATAASPAKRYKRSTSRNVTRSLPYTSMGYESLELSSITDMSSLMNSLTISHSSRLVALHKNHYIYYLSQRHQTWRALMKKPLWVCSLSSWCTTYNGLVVVGGDDPATGSSASVLDLIQKKEERLQELPHPVKAAGVIAVDDVVFIVGGAWYNGARWITRDDVYCSSLKPQPTQWKHHGTIHEPVCWPIVRRQAQLLYIIGGTDSRGVCVTHVQCYDIESATCTLLHSLPHPCSDISSGAVMINSQCAMANETDCMNNSYCAMANVTDCTDNVNMRSTSALEPTVNHSLDSGMISGATNKDSRYYDGVDDRNGDLTKKDTHRGYKNGESSDTASATNSQIAKTKRTDDSISRHESGTGQIIVYTHQHDMKYTIATDTWTAQASQLDSVSKNALIVNDLVHVMAWFSDNKRECYHHDPTTHAYTQVPSIDMSACVHCYYLFNIPIINNQ